MHFPCIMDTHNAVYRINVDFILDFLCMYYIIIINVMSTCAENLRDLNQWRKNIFGVAVFRKKKSEYDLV